MAGGAPPADVRAPGGSARAPTGERAPAVRRQLPGPLRRGYESEDDGGEVRRLPPRLRHVEDAGGALLHVDG